MWPKSAVCNSKWDEKHPRHFYNGVPTPWGTGSLLVQLFINIYKFNSFTLIEERENCSKHSVLQDVCFFFFFFKPIHSVCVELWLLLLHENHWQENHFFFFLSPLTQFVRTLTPTSSWKPLARKPLFSCKKVSHLVDVFLFHWTFYFHQLCLYMYVVTSNEQCVAHWTSCLGFFVITAFLLFHYTTFGRKLH